MGDEEPTLLTGSPTRSIDSDGSLGPELEEIPLVGRRRLPSMTNSPQQKTPPFWVVLKYNALFSRECRNRSQNKKSVSVQKNVNSCLENNEAHRVRTYTVLLNCFIHMWVLPCKYMCVPVNPLTK